MAAAVSLEEDWKTLSSRDVSELRAYFRDSENIGGVRSNWKESERPKGGKAEHDRTTDYQLAAVGRARRVERIRDGRNNKDVRVRDPIPAGAWSVLSLAFGEPRHDFPAGVAEDVANLLGDTETALEWGRDLVREADTEEAARRSYATARASGATPHALIEWVWSAMASVERTHIDDVRARDAAIERMIVVAGTLPSKRKKQEAKRFEAALVEAEGQIARAGHEYVESRQATGVNHIEDRRDDEQRQERGAIRSLESRVRLLAARPEAAE
jgi:hypothetical protein